MLSLYNNVSSVLLITYLCLWKCGAMLSLYRNVSSVLVMTYLCLCRCGAMLSLYRNVSSVLLMTCLCGSVERCYHCMHRFFECVAILTYGLFL